MALTKPAPPAGTLNASDPLGNVLWLAGLLPTTNPPLDDADGVAGVWTTNNGGANTPSFASGAGGANPYLDMPNDGVAGPATWKQLEFAGKAARGNDVVNGLTMWAVVRPTTNSNGCCVIAANGSGAIGPGIVLYGNLQLQVLNNYGNTAPSSGVMTLAAGEDQLVAIRITAAGLAKFYVHNYDTGVTMTPGTVDLGASLASWMPTGSSPGIINFRGQAGDFGLCFTGRFYAGGVIHEAVNDTTQVPTLYSNPWSPIGAPVLTAPVPHTSVVSPTSVSFVIPSPGGGTAPYANLKIYESPTANLTIGAPTLVQTTATPTFPHTFTRTGLTRGDMRFYRATVDDSAGTPATVTTAEVGVVAEPPLRLACAGFGQSHMFFVDNIASKITGGSTDLFAGTSYYNGGQSGSKTPQWLPGAAVPPGDPFSGANYFRHHLDAAATAFTGTNPTRCVIVLEFGINETDPAATVGSNLSAIMTAMAADATLLAAIGATTPITFLVASPILACPPQGGSAADNARLIGFLPTYRALDNGTNVRYLGDDVTDFCLNHQTADFYQSDGVHLTTSPAGAATKSGYDAIGEIFAANIHRVVTGVGVPSSGISTSAGQLYYLVPATPASRSLR